MILLSIPSPTSIMHCTLIILNPGQFLRRQLGNCLTSYCFSIINTMLLIYLADPFFFQSGISLKGKAKPAWRKERMKEVCAKTYTYKHAVAAVVRHNIPSCISICEKYRNIVLKPKSFMYIKSSLDPCHLFLTGKVCIHNHCLCVSGSLLIDTH